jgi:hypothetical protein
MRLPPRPESHEELSRLRARRSRPVEPLPPRAGGLALRVMREALAEAGPSIDRLTRAWPDIVGDRLATVTSPGKIISGKRGKELVVHVLPAVAVLIGHQTETIRQRASLAAGGELSGVRLVHGLPGAPRPLPLPPPPQPLSPQQRDALQADAEGFTHPGLKAAIVALGEAMLTRPR